MSLRGGVLPLVDEVRHMEVSSCCYDLNVRQSERAMKLVAISVAFLGQGHGEAEMAWTIIAVNRDLCVNWSVSIPATCMVTFLQIRSCYPMLRQEQ